MTNPEQFPKEFLELLARVKGKRSRLVIDHILAHGSITTEELEKTYGYKYPPRAIRDVREQGIPIERVQTKDAHGKTIAIYRFGAWQNQDTHKMGGRVPFPKSLKRDLMVRDGNQCSICLQPYNRYTLQIDYRVPYEVGGNLSDETLLEGTMLVCPACNRIKSWACEHCDNFLVTKSPQICQTCYWATPEQYDHMATQRIRRVDLVWQNDAIEIYNQLQDLAHTNQQSLVDFIKSILQRFLIS